MTRLAKHKVRAEYEAELQTMITILNSNDSAWVKQKQTAPLLRRLAIKHLKYGKGPVAEGFRETINHPDLQAAYTDFLDKQARQGAWGTYIELEALAEALGITIIVTATNSKGEENTWALHRVDEAKGDHAPVIHLQNINNTHWDYKGKALGDGNCMYNSLALAYDDVVLGHHDELISQIDDEFTGQAIHLQHERYNLISKVPTPSEKATELERERVRLAALPRNELEQIKNDRILALQLAIEEAQQTEQALTKARSNSCKAGYRQAFDSEQPRQPTMVVLSP